MASRPLGSVDLSTSDGAMVLIGRIGDGRTSVTDEPMALGEAVEALREYGAAPAVMGELRPHNGSSPYFPTGQAITWHYQVVTETARVIRDDASGLVAWKPSGSMGLVKRGVDGVGARDIPLGERFSRSWRMAEQPWKGPGVVQEAPTGVPWSIWWFWSDSGVFEGAYLNLELPHARPSALDRRDDYVPVELARTHSRDLTLDLWIEPGLDGAHELWLKDVDELDASVQQGRMSGRERGRFCQSVSTRVDASSTTEWRNYSRDGRRGRPRTYGTIGWRCPTQNSFARCAQPQDEALRTAPGSGWRDALICRAEDGYARPGLARSASPGPASLRRV